MAGGKGKSPREYGRRARSSRTAPSRGGGNAAPDGGAGPGAAPPAPSAGQQLMSPAGESTATAHSMMAGPDLQSGYFGGSGGGGGDGRPHGNSSAASSRSSFQLGDSQHSLEAGGPATGPDPAGREAPAASASGNDGEGTATKGGEGGAVDGKVPANLGADGRNLTISSSVLSMATSTGCGPLSTPLGDDNDDAAPPGEEATTAEDDVRLIGEIETARTRRNSIDEDILLGRKRDSSAASLESGASDGGGGSGGGKRLKASSALYARPLDIPPSAEYHASATGYSVRRNLDVPLPSALAVTDGSSLSSSGGDGSVESFRTAKSDLTEHGPDERHRGGVSGAGGSHHQTARWRSHRMAEDYVSLASSIVLPPVRVGPYGDVPLLGSYPVEQPTALGYLLSPLRRPTVIENWNPREIALFEASLSVHGKLFHVVAGHVGTKTTKEVVEFYYIWKKTAHYRAWKGRYRPLIMESDVSDDEEEEGDGGGR